VKGRTELRKAFKWSALGTAVAVALGSTAAVAAEGGVPEALNRVNTTLNTLIATVSQLAATVTQLSNKIGTPPAAPAALVTSPLQAGANLNQGNPNAFLNDRFICQVHNAGSYPAQVTTTVLDFAGVPVKVSDTTLAPGASETTNVESGLFVCRFTSLTNSLNQLRAKAMVRSRQTGSTIASAEAR